MTAALPGLTVIANDLDPRRRAMPHSSALIATSNSMSGEALSRDERRPVTIEDRALYIYTSGTTGLPKAANVSHARVMQWSHWFAGMMDAQPTDRMYNCLPMYHSVGGVQAPGAVLVGGGSVVIREKFSASQFWSDIVRWDCTLFQYIGELCRYLLHTAPSSDETESSDQDGLWQWTGARCLGRLQGPVPHSADLRVLCRDRRRRLLVQRRRKTRRHRPHPAYLAHRSRRHWCSSMSRKASRSGTSRDSAFVVLRTKSAKRSARLWTTRRMSAADSRATPDKEASEKKILRDVFEPGDAWVRTGDLMRKDEKGFFYFVDRIGDTFRWKGENVATSEVSEAICAFPGVKHANVYGVAIPGPKAGPAWLRSSPNRTLDLAAFREHLIEPSSRLCASFVPAHPR